MKKGGFSSHVWLPEGILIFVATCCLLSGGQTIADSMDSGQSPDIARPDAPPDRCEVEVHQAWTSLTGASGAWAWKTRELHKNGGNTVEMNNKLTTLRFNNP